MKNIILLKAGAAYKLQLRLLETYLVGLGFTVVETVSGDVPLSFCVVESEEEVPQESTFLSLPDGDTRTQFQSILPHLRFDFDSLPLLVEGESKIIRYLTDHVVLEKLKPTIYSFTHNRYGIIEGTDVLRAKFSADVLERLNRELYGVGPLPTAYLGTIESPKDGLLLVQRRAEDCNLEVRVKRYHIGSPLHRYRYAEKHSSLSGQPVRKWTRFESPVVCFDWRHPLKDENGVALADEPLPDDYAALWIADTQKAKNLAKDTFLWLENTLRQAGILLIDICFFIDKSGTCIYGEVSPDCMRARIGLEGPEEGEALDKDIWRNGKSAEAVRERYEEFYNRLVSLRSEELVS